MSNAELNRVVKLGAPHDNLSPLLHFLLLNRIISLFNHLSFAAFIPDAMLPELSLKRQFEKSLEKQKKLGQKVCTIFLMLFYRSLERSQQRHNNISSL